MQVVLRLRRNRCDRLSALGGLILLEVVLPWQEHCAHVGRRRADGGEVDSHQNVRAAGPSPPLNIDVVFGRVMEHCRLTNWRRLAMFTDSYALKQGHQWISRRPLLE